MKVICNDSNIEALEKALAPLEKRKMTWVEDSGDFIVALSKVPEKYYAGMHFAYEWRRRLFKISDPRIETKEGRLRFLFDVTSYDGDEKAEKRLRNAAYDKVFNELARNIVGEVKARRNKEKEDIQAAFENSRIYRLIKEQRSEREAQEI